jgi:DNA mismatch repair protein MutL
MSKIIKLDKNLANQIAAWEVVERPVSIIKELIENSIDANANNIKIEISWGWIDNITITDDGDWIEKEDLPLVIEKYSTSKIKNIEDLYNIMTFWFRWEAVASISSVSNIEIITKNNKENYWSSFKVIAWEPEKIIKYACETGTKIIVENLFYNTPARLNYLKKPRTEYNHILSFLQEVSLSYPKVGFEFFSDSKQIFKYPENEKLKTRIYSIYWNDFSDNLLKINFDLNWINISWYISDPKKSFANRNRQSLFVNNRVIKSNLIYKAINDAYNRFIPNNMFPAYVLNLQIDPTLVDVNVHPRKLEVRFASEQNIFRSVYHAIQEKLEKVSLVINQNNQENTGTTNKFYKPSFSNPKESSNWNWAWAWGYTWSWTKFKAYSPYSDKTANINQTKIDNALNFSKALLQNTEENNTIFEKSNDLHDTPLGKIIWQAHNSYIIIQTNEWIKFLDQHALAERIIYEKLARKDKKSSIQWLLIWESLSLTPKEIDIVENNKNTFLDMWFDFEIMPPNIIIINAIPSFIKKENVWEIFMWIIEDIWKHNFAKSKTIDEVKNKIWAYTSCRSAIKFWHKLNLFEMNKLLNDSILDYSSTCPHWRPVVFDISLNELKDKYER